MPRCVYEVENTPPRQHPAFGCLVLGFVRGGGSRVIYIHEPIQQHGEQQQFHALSRHHAPPNPAKRWACELADK